MKTHELWDIRFFNQIIDTMADGLFTLDSHGVITSWNRAMEGITEYSVKEALGAPFFWTKSGKIFITALMGGNP